MSGKGLYKKRSFTIPSEEGPRNALQIWPDFHAHSGLEFVTWLLKHFYIFTQRMFKNAADGHSAVDRPRVSRISRLTRAGPLRRSNDYTLQIIAIAIHHASVSRSSEDCEIRQAQFLIPYLRKQEREWERGREWGRVRESEKRGTVKANHRDVRCDARDHPGRKGGRNTDKFYASDDSN